MKNRLGLTLFWLGVVFLMVVAGGGGWGKPSLVIRLTEATTMGSLFWIWAFSAPFGAILVGVGLMLRAGVRSSQIWSFGIGVFLIVFITDFLLRGYLLKNDVQFPSPVFGVGGVLILLLFLASIWFAAEKRSLLSGNDQSALNFQMAGYIFFFLTAWMLCGYMGSLGEETQTAPKSSINIMIYSVLAWLFTMIGHYKAARRM